MVADDRATIADLEVYGLDLSIINALDRRGLMYVDQIVDVSVKAIILRCPRMGVTRGKSLTEALENFRLGRVVKTQQQCVRFEEE